MTARVRLAGRVVRHLMARRTSHLAAEVPAVAVGFRLTQVSREPAIRDRSGAGIAARLGDKPPRLSDGVTAREGAVTARMRLVRHVACSTFGGPKPPRHA